MYIKNKETIYLWQNAYFVYTCSEFMILNKLIFWLAAGSPRFCFYGNQIPIFHCQISTIFHRWTQYDVKFHWLKCQCSISNSLQMADLLTELFEHSSYMTMISIYLGCTKARIITFNFHQILPIPLNDKWIKDTHYFQIHFSNETTIQSHI